MNMRMATIGTIISLTCCATTCMAADGPQFTLTTKNDLDTISTLSVNGICSDSALMQPFETCSGGSVTGETPSHGQTTCSSSVSSLTPICGTNCEVKIYDSAKCTGNFATGQLNITDNSVTLSNLESPSEFSATYTNTDNYDGQLTLNS